MNRRESLCLLMANIVAALPVLNLGRHVEATVRRGKADRFMYRQWLPESGDWRNGDRLVCEGVLCGVVVDASRRDGHLPAVIDWKVPDPFFGRLHTDAT